MIGLAGWLRLTGCCRVFSKHSTGQWWQRDNSLMLLIMWPTSQYLNTLMRHFLHSRDKIFYWRLIVCKIYGSTTVNRSNVKYFSRWLNVNSVWKTWVAHLCFDFNFSNGKRLGWNIHRIIESCTESWWLSSWFRRVRTLIPEILNYAQCHLIKCYQPVVSEAWAIMTCVVSAHLIIVHRTLTSVGFGIPWKT